MQIHALTCGDRVDTKDLPYCGYIEPQWTLGVGHLRFYSECYIAPALSNWLPTKFYKYGIDLDLTCVAPNVNLTQSTILGKT